MELKNKLLRGGKEVEYEDYCAKFRGKGNPSL